jgi:hypothetical protein
VDCDVIGVLDWFETVSLVTELFARTATPGRAIRGDRGLGKLLGRGRHQGVLRIATEQRLQLSNARQEICDRGV